MSTKLQEIIWKKTSPFEFKVGLIKLVVQELWKHISGLCPPPNIPDNATIDANRYENDNGTYDVNGFVIFTCHDGHNLTTGEPHG